MTSGWGPWSGGFVAPDGTNIYPYKVEVSQSDDVTEYVPDSEGLR